MARPAQRHRRGRSRRNAEVLQAMGMAAALGGSGARPTRAYIASPAARRDVAGGLGAAVEGAAHGAAIGGARRRRLSRDPAEATAGIMIAGSILVSRALAPVELAIANWKGFVGARQSWKRLSRRLAGCRPEEPMPLPAAQARLVEGQRLRCRRASQRSSSRTSSFELKAGRAGHHRPERLRQVVAGPRARRRVAPARGKVRLDGAALDQWSPRRSAAHRLPAAGRRAVRRHRRPEHRPLRAGCRSGGDHRRAAQAAGVHEMILRLPEGYETQIGEGGAALSAGSASASPWPARSTAIRSWSCSTSRTPTSTPRASRR